jgi:hypothetical protein
MTEFRFIVIKYILHSTILLKKTFEIGLIVPLLFLSQFCVSKNNNSIFVRLQIVRMHDILITFENA